MSPMITQSAHLPSLSLQYQRMCWRMSPLARAPLTMGH